MPLRPSESGQVSENILFRRGTSDDITRVIEIWEVAVRSSHHFLSENDIIDIRQTVSQTISSVVGLFVAEGDFGELLGFTILAPESKAAQNQGHVYSLFVDPSFHGLGLGNEFLNFAKISYDALSLDVNEDNDKAREFYVKRGFSVVSRSEKDNQGRPFPLLRMVWKK
ncbi:MAG: GNAT family N-acetyltransferase [Deltaproteobacteria bacterium]|nr:GNAT family N-acetyltransferase [Deltaproteobacteria bacterium]